jgi:hypothetical protein
LRLRAPSTTSWSPSPFLCGTREELSKKKAPEVSLRGLVVSGSGEP